MPPLAGLDSCGAKPSGPRRPPGACFCSAAAPDRTLSSVLVPCPDATEVPSTSAAAIVIKMRRFPHGALLALPLRKERSTGLQVPGVPGERGAGDVMHFNRKRARTPDDAAGRASGVYSAQPTVVSCVMTEPKIQPIEIVDFKAEHYFADGKTIAVSFATKQSKERQFYTLPVASLYSFIADLQKLQSARQPAPGAAPSPSLPPAASPSPTPPAPTRIEVTVPKKWMARALPERNMVLMMFDPQTEKQAAYALPPGAVRDMAAVLVKEAERLAKGAPDKAASADS